jgi:hypothetical protein
MAETTAKTTIEQEWEKPLTCPVDPKELAECQACQ